MISPQIDLAFKRLIRGEEGALVEWRALAERLGKTPSTLCRAIEIACEWESHIEIDYLKPLSSAFLKVCCDLEGARIIYHSYTYEDYSGSATTVYEKGGKLYEVHGSHCSCFGLEDQWEPEETGVAVLKARGLLEIVALIEGTVNLVEQP